MSKTNFYDTVLTVMKADKRFVTEDGTFLRNAVYEAAMKMDADLLKLLLVNNDTRDRFFKDVGGIKVFDKIGFAWVINNRQFLPDSYTRFKNKVGLADENGSMISASNNIEIVFPYKDCVLEGGQTKEDQKRNEVFYNETLAPNEVDRLLFPKTFVNAKKYSLAEGRIKEDVALSFSDKDNIVIKGNNLLSIASLQKHFEKTGEKVKCIYIDVPYNTGNDSFGYNDRFNHSTWLCFMKNRLEIAHSLLSREGSIAISVDNYELGYLLVLLDEVFGKENRKNIITVKRGSVTGAKVINPGVVNIVEYVVIYSKNSSFWKPNRVFCARGYDDRYNVYINNVEEDYNHWTFKTVLEKWAEEEGVKSYRVLKKKYEIDYEQRLNDFVVNHAENIARWAALDESSVSEEAKKAKAHSKDNPNMIIHVPREDANDYFIRNGSTLLFAKDRLSDIDGVRTFSQPISDIWDDVLPNDLHNEGGVDLKKGKKPEKLIARILELCTNAGDIVVDFFAGSGTTGAVAMKMNRRFILCEQMDYIENTTCQRIKNTMEGESRGVSASYNWTGGGSFIYCELAKQNQTFVDKIETATDDTMLTDILNKILDTGFISHKINPVTIKESAEDFADLSFEDKKQFLMEILDKNLLYVNYCDIDDKEFNISENDKMFTRNFYREG